MFLLFRGNEDSRALLEQAKQSQEKYFDKLNMTDIVCHSDGVRNERQGISKRKMLTYVSMTFDIKTDLPIR